MISLEPLEFWYLKYRLGSIFRRGALDEWQPSYRIDRNDEITLARLRIGHNFIITHSFLLLGEDLPQCIPGQEALTVKHFLFDCTDFRMTRSRFFRVNGMKERFDAVDRVIIFSYLKEIGIYNKYNSVKSRYFLDIWCIHSSRWSMHYFVIRRRIAVDRRALSHTRLPSF